MTRASAAAPGTRQTYATSSELGACRYEADEAVPDLPRVQELV